MNLDLLGLGLSLDGDLAPDIAGAPLEDDAMLEEIELELALGDDEAFGADEAEHDSVDVDVQPSRVDRAARTRRVLMGSADNEEAVAFGYDQGYLQALRDTGQVSQEQFGVGFWALVGKGAAGLARGAVMQGRDPSEAGESGGRGFIESFRESAGIKEPLGKRVGSRLGSWLKARREDGAMEASAELGPDELPPVFVADDDEVELLVDDDSAEVSDEAFGVCDRFGSSWSGTQEAFGRLACRSASSKASRYGAARLQRAAPARESAFVQDVRATPVMFSDGKVYEPVYGRMHPVPCPSCTQAHDTSGCTICEEFGAILVPDSDVDSFVSSKSYYGLIIPLAIGLGAGAGLLASNKKVQKRVAAAAQALKKGKKAKKRRGKAKKPGSAEIPMAPDLDALEEGDFDIEQELSSFDDEIPMAPGGEGVPFAPAGDDAFLMDLEGIEQDLDAEAFGGLYEGGLTNMDPDFVAQGDDVDVAALVPASWWR